MFSHAISPALLPRPVDRSTDLLPHSATRSIHSIQAQHTHINTNANNACQTCYHFSEQELQARVEGIQDRTKALMNRAEDAVVALIKDLQAAVAAGHTDEQLAAARALQRKAQWRLDFVAAENSLGFHADQEAARILGESIDYARQGQLEVAKQGAQTSMCLGCHPPQAIASRP